MSDQPSAEEISFAQKRMKLQDVLAPYFAERVQSPDFRKVEISGNIRTEDGRRPRENTIKGQALITSAQFKTIDGRSHELALLIQHTEGWLPTVTVRSNVGGPVQTIVIRDDIESAIPAVKKLIDDAIDKARNW